MFGSLHGPFTSTFSHSAGLVFWMREVRRSMSTMVVVFAIQQHVSRRWRLLDQDVIWTDGAGFSSLPWYFSG